MEKSSSTRLEMLTRPTRLSNYLKWNQG